MRASERRKVAGTSSNKPIILIDDLDSNIGYFMGGENNLSQQLVNFMINVGRGLVYLCIREEEARRLKLNVLNNNAEDSKKDFTVSIDHVNSTTGISAFERFQTMQAVFNQDTKPEDFQRPGHVFPLVSKENRLLDRHGIAEAALFYAEYFTSSSAACVCEILNDNGKIATREELERLAKVYNLEVYTFNQLLALQVQQISWVEILRGNKIDELNNISVYELKNNFQNKEFKMYFNNAKFTNDNIIFYKPCQIGDLLGLDTCDCKLHFKDYYKQLVHREIKAIVFGNYDSADYSNSKNRFIKQAVMNQIHELSKDEWLFQNDSNAKILKAYN